VATTSLAIGNPIMRAMCPAQTLPKLPEGTVNDTRSSFERVAVLSDEDWLAPALRVLSFLVPGKVKGFRTRELEAAKTWLASDSD